MKKILLNWIVGSVAVFIAAQLLPGIETTSFWTAAIFAAILGFVNAILKPILTIVSFPFLLLTLGLFMVVINGLTLWAASAIAPGIQVAGFWSAVGGGIVISIATWLINGLLGRNKEEKKKSAAQN